MPDSSSQQFLRNLDKKRWTAADRQRANLHAGADQHAVYVSDSFAARQKEVETKLRDPQSGNFLDPADFKSAAEFEEARDTLQPKLLSGGVSMSERWRNPPRFKLTGR